MLTGFLVRSIVAKQGGGHGYNSPSDRMSLTKYHYGTREGDVEMESVFKDSAK